MLNANAWVPRNWSRFLRASWDRRVKAPLLSASTRAKLAGGMGVKNQKMLLLQRSREGEVVSSPYCTQYSVVAAELRTR